MVCFCFELQASWFALCKMRNDSSSHFTSLCDHSQLLLLVALVTKPVWHHSTVLLLLNAVNHFAGEYTYRHTHICTCICVCAYVYKLVVLLCPACQMGKSICSDDFYWSSSFMCTTCSLISVPPSLQSGFYNVEVIQCFFFFLIH